jgi:acetyl/propionyl-CoA carboxylase alpha subunit
MGLTDQDVREILRIIDESDVSELRVETNGFSLYVARHGGGGEDNLITVESPMLGTFYRAEAPGKPPFVEVGTEVGSDTIVCIIEVMKMMNSIPAGVSGTVVEVCAENAALVEYGAPLFRVKPA